MKTGRKENNVLYPHALQDTPADGRVECAEETIAIADLRVDTSYQRPPGWSWIHNVAAAYQPAIGEPIRVNRRPDGTLYVIDGQHRLRAAELAKRALIKCQVYAFATVAEEAHWFREWNRVRRMDARDLFRADLAAGDGGAMAIKRIVESCGYTLVLTRNQGKIPGAISCVEGLSDIYTRVGGEDHLHRILVLARLTWPDPANGRQARAGTLSRVILGALDRWYRCYDGEFEQKRFIASVGTHPHTCDPRRLSVMGAMRRDLGGMSAANVALLVIWDAYNYNLLRRNKLRHPFGQTVADDSVE